MVINKLEFENSCFLPGIKLSIYEKIHISDKFIVAIKFGSSMTVGICGLKTIIGWSNTAFCLKIKGFILKLF